MCKQTQSNDGKMIEEVSKKSNALNLLQNIRKAKKIYTQHIG